MHKYYKLHLVLQYYRAYGYLFGSTHYGWTVSPGMCYTCLEALSLDSLVWQVITYIWKHCDQSFVFIWHELIQKQLLDILTWHVIISIWKHQNQAVFIWHAVISIYMEL